MSRLITATIITIIFLALVVFYHFSFWCHQITNGHFDLIRDFSYLNTLWEVYCN